MSNIQWAAVPVTPSRRRRTADHSGSRRRCPRPPSRPCATGATSAPARAASALAAASATGARRSSPGSTTRPIATARASSDFAAPRSSRRGVLRREHEHERAWPGEASRNSRSSSAVQSVGITSHPLQRDRCRPAELSRSRAGVNSTRSTSPGLAPRHRRGTWSGQQAPGRGVPPACRGRGVPAKT